MAIFNLTEHAVCIVRTKVPTPPIQGIDKTISDIDERLKKLENMMKQFNEKNKGDSDTVLSLKTGSEER